MKTSIYFIALISLLNCRTEDTPESLIVGTWKLKEVYVNNTKKDLSACELKTYLEIPNESQLRFYHYYLQNSDCSLYSQNAKLYKNTDGSYTVDPPSIIDQNQKITRNFDTLVYTWDSWDFVNGNLETKPIKEIYEK